MLPLFFSRLPGNSAEFSDALREALRPVLGLAPRVEIDGDWPALSSLDVDFSGGKIPAELKPMPAAGAEAAAFTVDQLSLKAAPVRLEEAQASVAMEASGAQLFLAGPAAGPFALGVTAVKSGNFTLTMARAALETLIQAVAQKAAEPQGVTIERVKLEIASEGPSAVSFRAHIIAGKLFMSTAIGMRGRLSVDASLMARLENLSCSGTGMMGSLACGFIQPHVERLNNRSFPLTGFALGETRVTNVRLETGEPLRISAAFGNAPVQPDAA